MHARPTLATLLLSLSAPPALAQGLDLTVNHVGLAIGDVPRATGIRLNFRDRNFERVKGIHATIWSPYDEPSGVVRGLALGLPVTGAGRIDGLAVGVLGVGAARRAPGSKTVRQTMERPAAVAAASVGSPR
jgi:hypothetical protein